jgi:hypothetical protein
MSKNVVINAMSDLYGRDVFKCFKLKKYRNAIIIMKTILGFKRKQRKKMFRLYLKIKNKGLN